MKRKYQNITVKPRKGLILGPVICKNRHFQVIIKIVICEVLHDHLRHLQGMRIINANHHLVRFVPFEAVICEVLLYIENILGVSNAAILNYRVILL